MTAADRDLSPDEWDELTFPRSEHSDFDEVVASAVSRRGFLSGAVAFGSVATAMGPGLLGATPSRAHGRFSRFAFEPIAVKTDPKSLQIVRHPEGYKYQLLASWGDPLFSTADDYDVADGGPVENSDKVFGENNDGMESFVFEGRQLIAINHEYPNLRINLPAAQSGIPGSARDVAKLQNIQGVTVMEITETERVWSIVKDSRFNRRITHNSEMRIVGPAARHALLETNDVKTGPDWTMARGTMGNCGSGKTPWGTYLTCEENFNGYFGSTGKGKRVGNTLRDKGYERYGIDDEGRGYRYHEWDPRFDTSINPNEPHHFGWVVEIDPTNPNHTPLKHTGLGRFKHENAEVVLAPSGQVVVYMGDDERGEYLYKFVSNGIYRPGGPTDGLLDDGMLYAAKFYDDQTGVWLPLTQATTGMSPAEILIFTRMAASAVNATTMDRPEWVATNPYAVEAYCCLTNNKHRGIKPNAGGDKMPVGGPNPRRANLYGQIVRWRPHNDDHSATTFDWDLYVMAGNPNVHRDGYAGSNNIHAGNLFNSPDGMAFDTGGIVWIQTDGEDSNKHEYKGMGNNQMLAGDPVTGEIARFLTGPKGCEVTGLCWSADRRTMFVGIQHPGGHWPSEKEGELTRSSVIAIKRKDNGLVG